MLLGDVVEADDAYTGSHSRDVVSLVLEVANRVGSPTHAIEEDAEFAALLARHREDQGSQRRSSTSPGKLGG